MLVELNIDAIVGPTHHYGGIGVGNLASATHAGGLSHPRQAALEGLEKAAYVARLGIPQFMLPPSVRPRRDFLAKLGFSGEFSEQCRAAMLVAPQAYSAAFSSAFMWAANAATFAPANDCEDLQGHLTPANLCSSWHRLPESVERFDQLREMFAVHCSALTSHTEVHAALPPLVPLRDEGAANHMRLCDGTGTIGLHVFVYGEAGQGQTSQRFLPRQTLAASQAIARLHKLNSQHTFFLRQHPAAIDAGVFHNDVIATSHENVLLHHELAYIDADDELERLEQTYAMLCRRPLTRICIAERELSLADAVSSYLFNSQLLTPALSDSEAGAGMVLLCAAQCSRMPQVRALVDRLIVDETNPITAVHFVSLDESMAGGGGPACLRLRVQLPASVLADFAPRYRWTPELDAALRRAMEMTYPEQLTWHDLCQPQYLTQFAAADHAIANAFTTNATR